MESPECETARQDVVRLRNSIPLTGKGCRAPTYCRLSQVRQIRAIRRILDSLTASYGLRTARLRRELPRIPANALFIGYVDGVSFWEAVSIWVKKLSNLSPAQVRKFLPPSRANLEARTSLSFSLSLFGKSLHPPCACYSEYKRLDLKHQASVRRTDNVSPEYLGFARQVSKRLFPRGWDSSYVSLCTSSIVSSNASFTRGRKAYGPLADHRSQVSYLQAVLGEEDFKFSVDARFSEVLSAGKVRPLTITDSSYEYLRPLHKTLYNFISRFPWLLRGSPTPESFAFVQDEGLFVSVDFEAATDNLSVNVAEAILGAAFTKASWIPPTIRSFALKSLRPRIHYEAEFGASGMLLNPEKHRSGECECFEDLAMGQMMGSLLSFPLLCLQTFIFYLWSEGLTDLSGRSMRAYNRCLVNGDDLVFKTMYPSRFFSMAEETCSVINSKKTHVSERFFNINSTLFKSKVYHPLSIIKEDVPLCRSIPFLRPKQIDIDTVLDCGSIVREATRWLSHTPFLKRTFDHLMSVASRLVKQQGWSFSKAGFSGQKQEKWLRDRGLLDYETRLYLAHPDEPPPPEPESDLAEPMRPLPDEWRSFEPYLKETTMLYNAWARFNFSVDGTRSSTSIEKELKRDTFNLLASERLANSRKAKAKKMGYASRSRFPVAIRDVYFSSRRNVYRFVQRRLITGEEKRESIPSGLLSLMSKYHPNRLCHSFKDVRVHWRVLERFFGIFELKERLAIR